jgi:hypothetical protein
LRFVPRTLRAESSKLKAESQEEFYPASLSFELQALSSFSLELGLWAWPSQIQGIEIL